MVVWFDIHACLSHFLKTNYYALYRMAEEDGRKEQSCSLDLEETEPTCIVGDIRIANTCDKSYGRIASCNIKGHTMMTVIETRKTIRTASFGVTQNHLKKLFTCLAPEVSDANNMPYCIAVFVLTCKGEVSTTLHCIIFYISSFDVNVLVTILILLHHVCVYGVNYFDNIHSFFIIAATAEAVHCSIRPLRRLGIRNFTMTVA